MHAACTGLVEGRTKRGAGFQRILYMPRHLLQAKVKKTIICSVHSSARPYAAAISLSSIDRFSLSSIHNGAARLSSKLRASRFIASESYSCYNTAREKANSLKKTGYTTSFILFEALWEAGVQACFVNLGSDHPGIIEAMIKGQKERPDRFPRMYTCPNEMVALSMADGWARMTGQPQAVIVHVDVGTQALGAAMHNANTGRVPVLIFAGLCPYTENGELPGSRTEYQHWLQDAPDQKAIVRQYCRYVGELRTARTTKDTVARAFQFATSDPKGPVYLVGAREVMAETITEPYALGSQRINSIQSSALPHEAIETIAEALVQAKSPLIITGYSGRNHACPSQLVNLAETIPGLRVHDTGGCDMCFPFSHRSSLGFRLSFDQVTTEADVILVLDCDVPWIPIRNRPRDDARIYHVDVDPLNATIGASFFPADGRWRADSYTALSQLNAHLATSPDLKEALEDPIYAQRWQQLQEQHLKRLASYNKLNVLPSHAPLNIHYVGAAVKSAVPPETNYVVEAATCSMNIADQLRVDVPGSWLNSGGAGLGWSGGAALGVKLALDASGRPNFVCQIVGDGTYLFSVPSSVYWIAARYGIPVLTIILNNRGWTAPRRSLELCQPSEQALKATNREMNISLDPAPDYCGIAKAAAGSSFGGLTDGLFTGRASTAGELADVLKEAVMCVKKGRGAVVEAVLNIGEMGEEKAVDS